MLQGWFITFEGGEGVGKTTQVELLRQRLEAGGHRTLVTREPGGTPLAEAIRALLLGPGHDPDGLSELFLLAASRHDHVERVVRPALTAGQVVLCDRFGDSSTVYQGVVRKVGVEVVEQVNRLATGGLEPRLTIVLDMDPQSALARVHLRNAGPGGTSSRFDDEEDAFHRQVREGFVRLAEARPLRVRLVDAAGEASDVHQRVVACLPEELR